MDVYTDNQLRRLRPVFNRTPQHFASVPEVLDSLCIGVRPPFYVVKMINQSGDQFYNMLELKHTILLVYQYYSGCICHVEEQIRAYNFTTFDPLNKSGLS